MSEATAFNLFHNKIVEEHGLRVGSILFGLMNFPHRPETYKSLIAKEELEMKLKQAIMFDRHGCPN